MIRGRKLKSDLEENFFIPNEQQRNYFSDDETILSHISS